MRLVLGAGYVDALRSTWSDVPESADFVMYWWHKAAELTRRGDLIRFGLITTNSLRQAFNRRVVERHLLDKKSPLSLVYAVPDHPWVDATEGAGVRIAMTVGTRGLHEGALKRSKEEPPEETGEVPLSFSQSLGLIHPDLSIGVNVSGALPLMANSGLALRGITLVGSGFLLSPDQAAPLRRSGPGAGRFIRPFLNGRDLTQQARGVFVIDLFGLDQDQARRECPALYQWVRDRVKPERDQNQRPSYRERWWIFAEPRPEFRRAAADLSRFIATPMTAKHRLFLFLPKEALPDQGLVPIASSDALDLGVLSSRPHVTWALATGGTLEDRPRYNQSRCFETFPVPTPTEAQAERIRALAEDLDAHRKRQQAAHDRLTLTGMYNVLEKLKAGETLTAKEREIHEQGLVSILKQLHDELDLAVLDAYGWADLAPLMEVVNGNAALATAGAADREEAVRTLDETLLERLVALNAERAAEERRGLVRWLRPEFQQPDATPAAAQEEIDLGETPEAIPAASRRPWPKTLTEQVTAVAEVFSATPTPLTEPQLAAHFKARGPWRRRLANILEMLVTLGRARQENSHYRAMGDAA